MLQDGDHQSAAGPSPPSPDVVGEVQQSQREDGSGREYLATLLLERENLCPYKHILPICSTFLEAEILRVKTDMKIPTNVTPIKQESPQEPQNKWERTHQQPPDIHRPLSAMHHPPDMQHMMHHRQQYMDPRNYIGHNGGAMGGPFYPASTGPESPLEKKPPPNSVVVTRKVMVPIDKHPGFNFVGRILGPGGSTLKKLESESGCRVAVGRGCLRTREEEEKKKRKTGWEHLAEPLHVVLTVELPEDEANEVLDRTEKLVNALLVPPTDPGGMDEVKREQLSQLAMMKDEERSDIMGGDSYETEFDNRGGGRRGNNNVVGYNNGGYDGRFGRGYMGPSGNFGGQGGEYGGGPGGYGGGPGGRRGRYGGGGGYDGYGPAGFGGFGGRNYHHVNNGISNANNFNNCNFPENKQGGQKRPRN